MRARPTLPGPPAPSSSGFTIEIVRSEADFARLEPDWRRLASGGAHGAPFRSFAWLHTFWLHFGAGVPGRELYLVLARDSAGLVRGILPLYRERIGALPAWRARLLGAGAVGSDYLGLVCPREDEAALARALAAPLAAEILEGATQAFDLADLDEQSSLFCTLAVALRGRVHVGVRRRRVCPTARPQPFTEYLAERPDGAGRQLQRRLRWLERRPGFAFETLTAPTDVSSAFGEFLALHRERWAREGGGDGIATPALEAFHREAAARLAEAGLCELSFLRVGGCRRAALYGLLDADAGAFLFYQSGHEWAWRPRSVGTVLLGLCIERAFARGLVFDFGHGEEPYKGLWATGAERTALLRLARPYSLAHGLDGVERARRLAGGLLRRVLGGGR